MATVNKIKQDICLLQVNGLKMNLKSLRLLLYLLLANIYTLDMQIFRLTFPCLPSS